ncbi:helix-turn-helix transcriptional regulator [Rahnella sp. SAP-1]|uniref:Helix-turn-helix transcriptional regulator n=1 Tax=Rouxiella aceris TaxID=2703884 RepID=A0A848MLC2_9GAMM|nr:helix-turn-helix domain-containing protein [Rouxiella aceris]NMP28525.1 helix-turn-helix transcriptional regulator [Rouxiella aceris]
MATLKEMLAQRSPESRQRIADKVSEIKLEIGLAQIREVLALSQTQVARKLNIAQPSVAAIEQRGSELKLSTLKRYFDSMGATLRLDVELPDGQHVAISL